MREVCIRKEGVRAENCVVVRNGIDLDHFDTAARSGLQAPLPVPDGAAAVAVIGNLWPVKGHRTLVEAVAPLPLQLHAVRFLCAGEGPEREYLADRVARLGLRERVLLSPEQAREMGVRGRRLVESALTMEKMAEGHGALYRRALAAAPAVREPELRAA